MGLAPRSVRIQAITCLPSLAIAEGEIACAGIRIAPIDFDDWLAFEGQSESGAYDKVRGKYSRNPPFFLHQTIDVDPALVEERGPEQTRALFDAASPEIEAFAKALHFYLGVAPIDPLRSVTYFDVIGAAGANANGVAQNGVPRTYGESDKEYVVHNENPKIRLEVSETPALDQVLAFARRSKPIWSTPQHDLAWRSLSLSSVPGLHWPTRVLMIVGALEALILSELREGLKAAFERRVSVLAADDAGSTEVRKWLGPAYRLRSDVVHGRSLRSTLAQLPEEPESYLKTLGQIAVTAICRLVGVHLARGGSASDEVGPFLDAALPQTIGTMLQTAGVSVPHRWEGKRC